MKINHLIKLNLIQSVVLMSLLISNVSLSEEIKNINDIFKDSTGNIPRTNTVLRDFYQKDITEKNNLTIDCILSTQIIIYPGTNSMVWNSNKKDKYEITLYPNLIPAFRKNEKVNIFGINYSINTSKDIHTKYFNGGVTKSDDVQDLTKVVYLNIFKNNLKISTSSDKIHLNKNIITFQEIDIKVRKLLMNRSDINLYKSQDFSTGYWILEYADKTKETNLFTIPEYRYNTKFESNQISHIDVYLVN